MWLISRFFFSRMKYHNNFLSILYLFICIMFSFFLVLIHFLYSLKHMKWEKYFFTGYAHKMDTLAHWMPTKLLDEVATNWNFKPFIIEKSSLSKKILFLKNVIKITQLSGYEIYMKNFSQTSTQHTISTIHSHSLSCTEKFMLGMEFYIHSFF